MENKTLRDEIAMSMSFDSIPVIQNDAMAELISEKFGLELNEDPIVQIKWAVKYQAVIRYMYADAMLAQRIK